MSIKSSGTWKLGETWISRLYDAQREVEQASSKEDLCLCRIELSAKVIFQTLEERLDCEYHFQMNIKLC